MRCPTCGLINEETAAKCARCTHPFTANEHKEAVKPILPNTPPIPQIVEAKKRTMFSKVMTVIGVMLAIVLLLGLAAGLYFSGGVQSARGKAHDAGRVADIKTMMAAAEMYYSEFGEYPEAQSDLVPDFITSIPKDPETGASYQYARCGKHAYHIGATLTTQYSALAGDSDRSAACGGDPISGADTGPCLPPPAQASGYCYDEYYEWVPIQEGL